jgi:hypothetical protein
LVALSFREQGLYFDLQGFISTAGVLQCCRTQVGLALKHDPEDLLYLLPAFRGQ